MKFTDFQIERYSRQMILPDIGPEGQELIRGARILIVGMGGLGSPAAYYLTAAGVGRLGLIDYDTVDASNLQRQILHGESDLGKPKVESARKKLKSLNSEVDVVIHPTALNAGNAEAVIGGYDFIIEGSDNFTAKYLVNDACCLRGKPFVIAGILKYEGQVTTVLPGESGCYRCLFPAPPPPDSLPTCASAGVLGPIAGVIGSLQAAEALKYVAGLEGLLTNTFMTLDLKSINMKKIKYSRQENCPACGLDSKPDLKTEAMEKCVPEKPQGVRANG